MIDSDQKRHGRRFASFVQASFSTPILMLAMTVPAQAQVAQSNAAAGTPAKPSAAVTSPGLQADATPSQSLLQKPPTQATIDTTAGKLKIEATNASLTQTLQRISEKTGMQVDGVTGDERVFGTFGPGDPRDVLISLLDGTSYNVIMVGTLESGAPRELLLSQRSTSAPVGPVQPQTPPPAVDDDTPDPGADDGPQPMPSIGRPVGPGPGGQGPRNPQDLLQQLRQQQQQQQNQPQ